MSKLQETTEPSPYKQVVRQNRRFSYDEFVERFNPILVLTCFTGAVYSSDIPFVRYVLFPLMLILTVQNIYKIFPPNPQELTVRKNEFIYQYELWRHETNKLYAETRRKKLTEQQNTVSRHSTDQSAIQTFDTSIPDNLLATKKFEQLRIECLYHITHMQNLQSILQRGLLSHNTARNGGHISTDISDPQVQERRVRSEPIHRRSLHDYVPLYFNPKNPMLYRRSTIQNNLVILAIDRRVLTYPDTIFTDGNAAATQTNFYSGFQNLDELNWHCINSRYWNDHPDGKRIKCSEALVYPMIESASILRIYCQNSSVKESIIRITDNFPNVRVEIRPNFYF
jgi:hypothetical protein